MKMSWKNSFNRRTGSLTLAGLVLLVTIMALQGCSEGGTKRSLIVVGSPAPSFTIELFDGNKWTLEDHGGKPIVIAFMASWCPCSNESIPFIKEAYERYNPQGVEFILIGIQDSAEKFRNFLEERDVTIPAGYDTDDTIAALYGVDAPPVTIFIDREQKVKRVYFGNIKEAGKEYFSWIEEVR